MFVVGIATMALVVILSIFNGLEGLLKSLYGSFDPEIKIEAAAGKSFVATDSLLDLIRNHEGVEHMVKVIEDNAYVRYDKAEMVVVLKGVSRNYLRANHLEDKITEGRLQLWNGNIPMAIIGQGVQFNLAAVPENDFYSLQVFYPRKVRSRSLNPNDALKHKSLHVSGVFAIERQFDEKYIIVPIEFCEDLMNYKNRLTSLEITTGPGQEDQVKESLQEKLGDQFRVMGSNQQHAVMLRTVKIEKFFVFLVFAFIIGVSSINIFFALSMLVIDKKRDISMLFAMGANRSQIRKIFLLEGMIISLAGALLGLGLGYLFCLLQQKIGLLSMGLQTGVVNFYPVKMEGIDFISTCITIIAVTLLASWRPSALAARSDQETLIL